MKEWPATRARESFSDLIDAAVDGTPQLVRRRDGKAVVVVSKEHFDRHQPNLRDYLLNSGYAEEHDAFDDALQRVRGGATGFPAPRSLAFEE